MTDVVSPAPWTIQKALLWASEDFRKKGFDHPRLEAELLLGDVLQLDRVRLIVLGSAPLGDQDLTQFRQKILRRRSGEPLAYIVGHREFFGRKFFVDARVLIPRADTEILVEAALQKTQHRALFGRALDLCTGSGCIAISFAKRRPTWRVTGVDVSEEAISVARKNAVYHGALWGVRFLVGDLFQPLAAKERFELIVSNPPYIPQAELATLDVTVRDFEPRLALAGGDSGLDFYPRLAKGALKSLVPGGVLAVEVGAGQAEDVQRLFVEAGFTDPERVKDYGGHERVVLVRAPRSDG